ncbi:hypothetical protein C0995_001550 [Termitomyces sp. Mi166|nr:hypothetical protein C0995_001550 [Termitomyces sp. Mi166\
MSTMLEAFDTPMVDFQADPDYSMQLSSSDPWFQEEATMDDDGHIPQTTIEVDMESYDEHHQPEYEMEDDLETVGAAPNDIHDVEVHDASRFQSPEIPHDASPVVDPTEPPPTATEDTENSNYVFTSSEIATEYTELSSHVFFSETQKQDDSTSHEQYHRSPSPHQPEASLSLTTEEPTLLTETILPTEDYLEGAGLTVTNEVHDSSNAVVEEFRTERRPEAEDFGESTLEGETSETAEVHAHPELPGEEVNQHVEEYAVPPEFEDSTNDPHEISEGVYIDPPPPVLISLFADEPSISLFNLPSKSRLDSDLQNESDAPELVVLLGQLPTLYYEPLSSVFEAFRQEEYLSGIPGLLSGELLFDAYDLELTMSEDYTYAHELSLHDLNVLHDGLNKSGPLRLRLRTVKPRFIDRYHLLQNQIAQFQIMEPMSEREISSVNPTEEDSDADHATGAEAFVKESTIETVVSGVEPPVQAEAPGADFVTDVEAHDAETYQHEDVVDDFPALHEKLDKQQDDHKAQQETEAFEEPEEVSEESTTPIVETDNTEEITNHNLPGFETDKDVCDDVDDHENKDGLDTHADKPQQQNEFEQVNTEDVSTDVQHPDFSVESEIEHSTQEKGESIRLNGPHIIKTNLEWLEDIAGIDEQHLDETETESHEDNEESGSVIANLDECVVKLDPTTEANEELNQTNALVANHEVTEDVLDGPDDEWNDSLDGDGEWEAEEDDDDQGHRHEQSYDHEHEHEHGHDHEHGHEHEHDTGSNSSSVTLSSKSSFKRSLSEAELEEYVEDDFSPDPKKPRVE